MTSRNGYKLLKTNEDDSDFSTSKPGPSSEIQSEDQNDGKVRVISGPGILEPSKVESLSFDEIFAKKWTRSCPQISTTGDPMSKSGSSNDSGNGLKSSGEESGQLSGSIEGNQQPDGGERGDDQQQQPDGGEGGDDQLQQQPDGGEGGNDQQQHQPEGGEGDLQQPDGGEGGDDQQQPDGGEGGDDQQQPDGGERGDDQQQPDGGEGGDDQQQQPDGGEGGDDQQQPDGGEGGDHHQQQRRRDGGERRYNQQQLDETAFCGWCCDPYCSCARFITNSTIFNWSFLVFSFLLAVANIILGLIGIDFFGIDLCPLRNDKRNYTFFGLTIAASVVAFILIIYWACIMCRRSFSCLSCCYDRCVRRRVFYVAAISCTFAIIELIIYCNMKCDKQFDVYSKFLQCTNIALFLFAFIIYSPDFIDTFDEPRRVFGQNGVINVPALEPAAQV